MASRLLLLVTIGIVGLALCETKIELTHNFSTKMEIEATNGEAFNEGTFKKALDSARGEKYDSDKGHILVTYEYRIGTEFNPGDRAGGRIDIEFDGEYTVYELVYHVEDGKNAVRSVERRHNSLDLETIESLKATIDDLISSSAPRKLPDINPNKVKLEGPSESVTLKVRQRPSGDQLTYSANMGAESRHYPSEFLELRRKLRDILSFTSK